MVLDEIACSGTSIPPHHTSSILLFTSVVFCDDQSFLEMTWIVYCGMNIVIFVFHLDAEVSIIHSNSPMFLHGKI